MKTTAVLLEIHDLRTYSILTTVSPRRRGVSYSFLKARHLVLSAKVAAAKALPRYPLCGSSNLLQAGFKAAKYFFEAKTCFRLSESEMRKIRGNSSSRMIFKSQ